MRNLNLPRLTKRRVKQTEDSDYGLLAGEEDGLNEYGFPDLNDEGIQPEQKKQLVPKPPTYEESLNDFVKDTDKAFSTDED